MSRYLKTLQTLKQNLKTKNKYIVYNTAIHVIDILVYIFGKQIVKFKSGNLNSPRRNLSLILTNKSKIPIFCNISFNTPENNSIKIKMNDQSIYELKPIETLTKYKGMKIVMKDNLRKYIPKKIFTKIEKTEFKPGFKDQMKSFLFQTKKFNLSELKDTNKLIQSILK